MGVLATARAFILVGGLFGGGLLAGSATSLSAWGKGRSPYEGLETLARVLTNVELYYVDDVATDSLLRDAIRGMVSHLDAHSMYLDAETWQKLQSRNEDPLTSLGLVLTLTPDGPEGLVLGELVPDGPAARAGAQMGDVLVAVDGVDVRRWPVEDVSRLLSGAAGEVVALDLLRAGAPVRVEALREQVIEPAVESGFLSPGYGYARLIHFRHSASQELRRALEKLIAEGGPLKGVVLDLRDNPGGMLEEAVGVADLFLTQGRVVSTRGRVAAENFSLSASAGVFEVEAPLVVLINGGSASASEIVAGCLHDHKRARLVGTHTYGKGSVQSVYEFEDGSALKLTVARYYLPNGEPIEDGKGVAPDLEVALDAAIPREGPLTDRLAQDPQLAAALDALITSR